MLSLFIIFVHGGRLSLKLATKPALATASAITITVYYDDMTQLIEVSGCDIIKQWLTDSAHWFKADPNNDLALLLQLFDKTMQKYGFKPHQIYLSFEANWRTLGGTQLPPTALTVINHTRPGTVLFPVGTPECSKFIHYWMTYHEYPHLDLSDEFTSSSDYYTQVELSPDKIADLQNRVGPMLITCPPPFLATFDKKKLPACMMKLLARIAVANPDFDEIEDDVNPIDQTATNKASLSLQTSSENAVRKTSLKTYSNVYAFTSVGVNDKVGDTISFLASTTVPTNPRSSAYLPSLNFVHVLDPENKSRGVVIGTAVEASFLEHEVEKQEMKEQEESRNWLNTNARQERGVFGNFHIANDGNGFAKQGVGNSPTHRLEDSSFNQSARKDLPVTVNTGVPAHPDLNSSSMIPCQVSHSAHTLTVTLKPQPKIKKPPSRFWSFFSCISCDTDVAVSHGSDENNLASENLVPEGHGLVS